MMMNKIPKQKALAAIFREQQKIYGRKQKGFHILDSHPFFIVPSPSSFTYPCVVLSQDAQQQTPPSATPFWALNPVFWTSKT
eukprot:13790587-Ditylum_brightwellii.AAC.1